MENISIDISKKEISIEVVKKEVVIEMQNRQGPPGPPGIGTQGIQGVKGDQGIQGVAGTGGDATYPVSFSFTNSVFVNHQLGKHPSIVLEDSAGTAYKGFSVDYHDLNTCTVSWLPMFTGHLTAN